MAFNGSGTFNRLYNWVTDDSNGINIEPSRMDGEDDGFATGLSNCITKDGQTTITANIPFNSKKITGLANGSARTDSIALGQVQDNQFGCLGTTGGSADAYTLTPSPAITAYTATMEFTVKINATNATTTPYLQISGIANPATNAVIKKLDDSKSETSLAVGDLVANGIYKFKRNSANDSWIVLNPLKATTTTQGISYLNKPVTIANNATDANNDIDFSAGVMNFSDESGQAVATALTKQLDAAWAAGDNAGGLFSGSIAADTWYHCFAIWNPTTNTYDAGFDTSVTAANIPSGFTKYERRGSILTDSSSNILAFIQDNNTFSFDTSITELDTTTTTAVSDTPLTITTPLGIRTKALMRSTCNSSTNSQLVRIFAKDKSTSTDREVNGCGRDASQPRGVSNFELFTNTSSQINYSTSLGGAGTGTYNFTFQLDGWVDYQLKF